MESDGMLWNVGLGECITSCITCIAWELLVIKYLSGLGVSKYMSFHFLGIKLQQIHSRFWRMTFHAMHFSKMLPSTVPQLSVKHPSNPNLLFQNAWTQNYHLLKRNMPISQWSPGFPFRSTAVASRSSISTSRVLCSWNKIQQNVPSSLLPRRSPARKTKNHLSYTIWIFFSENKGIPDHKSILIIKPSFGKKNPSAMGNQSS